MLRPFRLEEPESVADVSELLEPVWRIGQGVCRRNGASLGDERRLGSLRAVDQRQKCEGS